MLSNVLIFVSGMLFGGIVGFVVLALCITAQQSDHKAPKYSDSDIDILIDNIESTAARLDTGVNFRMERGYIKGLRAAVNAIKDWR